MVFGLTPGWKVGLLRVCSGRMGGSGRLLKIALTQQSFACPSQEVIREVERMPSSLSSLTNQRRAQIVYPRISSETTE